ncbi:MAG: glycosyltransferase family 4 protein [Anaerolineaceae bacterium]|nr:glycosyltransferase family 4 protein [Anaerolineaceae bacterium]
MPPRILICRSNPIAPDPRVEKIARALVGAGYSVHTLGWDRTGLLPAHERRDGYGVDRLGIVAQFGQGMGNLPQLIRWQGGLTGWLIRHHNDFDCIHACDFDTIIPALWMRQMFHKKVIYDIFDFYADHLRKTPGWIKGMIRRIDIQAVNTADAVIIVDDSRREQLLPGHPRRVEVIYNSPEDCIPAVLPIPEHPDGKKRLRIAYIGLLQVERGLIEILRILRIHPEWTLDLAGFGGDQERILQEISDLDNVVWYGRVPYDRALELSQGADVLFATYDPSIPNHRYSSPNKVFEAMMLAKPLVVARGTNVDRTVEEYQCGLVVSYGDIPDLEEAFTRLTEDAEFRNRLGRNGRMAYEKAFGWPRMRDKLLGLYRGLTQGV